MKEPKTLQDFIPLLEGWWDVNEFEGNVTIEGQFRKLIEEVHELFEGIKKKDEKEIKDAFGDLQVVCVMGCFIRNHHLNFTLFRQHDEIFSDSSKSIKSINDLIVELIRLFRQFPCDALIRVRGACLKSGYDPDECLAQAWNEIKDRRGHWENGVFVKHVKQEVLHMTDAPEVGTMIYALYDNNACFNWRWDGDLYDLACLESGKVYATREFRDRALALRKEGK